MMRIHIDIDETDEFDKQEEDTDISQDFKKTEGDYFPVRTQFHSYLDEPTWMRLLDNIVDAIELHYGYKIKNKIAKEFPDES